MATYSINYNGLTIDGTSGFKVVGLQGVHGMEIQSDSQPLPGLDGGNIFQQNYNMRNIGIDGQIFALDPSTYFTNIRALVKAFTKQNNALPLTIQMWDGTSKIIFCKVSITPLIPEIKGRVTYNDFRIELIAENPFFQDINPQIFTTNLALSGGFAIPFKLSFAIGGTTNNQFSINNVGDETGYPEFFLYGPLVNPSIQNITTGQSLTINTIINTGDYVHIFLSQKGLFILLNDSTSYYPYYNGSYFGLVNGMNVIKFTSSSYNSIGYLKTKYVNYYDQV